MSRPFSILLPFLLIAATTAPSGYFNDLANTPLGKPLDEFMILNGDFTVADFAGHHCLELPGNPLDTFGLLFGPGDSAAADISARIWADSTGKRFPEFGIGGDDVGGYKLWVLPGQGMAELRKADDPQVHAPITWTPGTWLHLRLRIQPGGPKKWSVNGKLWPDGSAEPADWLLHFEDTEEPSPGKASIWGIPFSGKPIRFDDLTVKAD